MSSKHNISNVTREKAEDILFEQGGKFTFYYVVLRSGEVQATDNANTMTSSALDLCNQDWNRLMTMLSGTRGGELPDWKRYALQAINPQHVIDAAVDLIPALRSLREIRNQARTATAKGHTIDGIRDHSGVDLIEELFKLRSPAFGAEADRERFDLICKLLKDITENSSAMLEVPHDKSALLVNMDDKRLPIHSLGSSIEELVIIVAKSTLFRN